uniref:Fcf2 pre-rRNA processing C-terminal domain-containing protein n=1 Tax=Mola mola TaxID=94237 RepID=A0A3Q3XE03_MOLML
MPMSTRIDPGIRVKELGGLYINFDGSKSKPVSSSLQKLKEKNIQDEVMKKSVIGPDIEKKDAVPPSIESKRALKLKRRAERDKTTGDGWFNMKAPEITQELKGDLQVLKMRGTLDSKRFYKKNDREGFPKYFQVGTVVDNPVDFHSRIPKKNRKRTMVEELLADAEFRHKNKKKYQQVMAEKTAKGAGKRNKKKNKFHKKGNLKN